MYKLNMPINVDKNIINCSNMFSDQMKKLKCSNYLEVWSALKIKFSS